jgi:hypothetical protein
MSPQLSKLHKKGLIFFFLGGGGCFIKPAIIDKIQNRAFERKKRTGLTVFSPSNFE